MNAGTLPDSGPSGMGTGGVAPDAAGASVTATPNTAKNERLTDAGVYTRKPG